MSSEMALVKATPLQESPKRSRLGPRNAVTLMLSYGLVWRATGEKSEAETSPSMTRGTSSWHWKPNEIARRRRTIAPVNI
jgi:hypothetical protein